jgi:predicted phosphate transport protein (TIGR00153 family)
LPRITLLPRDRRFSILFQQSADNLVRMGREFKELVFVWENIKERVSMLADMERDGDAITHDVMAMLHRTFITPFDREDISLLARSLDDVADQIHSAADIMLLYGVERPTDRAKELADIIDQVCREVSKGVAGISGPIDQNQLLKACVEINRLENMADDLYRRTLAELFAGSPDAVHVIKWREVYEDMESAIDGAEVVADVLEEMALKYA